MGTKAKRPELVNMTVSFRLSDGNLVKVKLVHAKKYLKEAANFGCQRDTPRWARYLEARVKGQSVTEAIHIARHNRV